YIRRIDELGGAVRAIETRFMQREIEESSYRWQQQVESGERIVVGVNRYRMQGGQEPELLQVDEAQERAQIERLARVRRERDQGAGHAALAAVREAAQASDTLMPRPTRAGGAYASIAAIAG